MTQDDEYGIHRIFPGFEFPVIVPRLGFLNTQHFLSLIFQNRLLITTRSLSRLFDLQEHQLHFFLYVIVI
jgi:hypothetical protein